MYNSFTDTYTCDVCGFEMAWDASDLVHGEMWGCEKCGNSFCSKCFIDRYGRERLKHCNLSTIPKKDAQNQAP